MGADVSKPRRGANIKVGVIDTVSGPHPNLKHVTLVGAFVDRKSCLPRKPPMLHNTYAHHRNRWSAAAQGRRLRRSRRWL
jgi:hypothetical protein